jgi:hypothetical protein
MYVNIAGESTLGKQVSEVAETLMRVPSPMH